MDKKEFLGSCHCGNIRYRFRTDRALAELPVRICGCSFCRRHGARYTADPGGELAIEFEDESAVRTYQFATKVVDFVICTNCGVMPVALTRVDEKTYAVVNANTMHEMPTALSKSVDFWNETLEEGRQRRSWTWIGSVTVGGAPGYSLQSTTPKRSGG